MKPSRPGPLVAAMAAAVFSTTAAAFPTKPIRIVVAYTPAGTTDILARVVGQRMSEAWASR